MTTAQPRVRFREVRVMRAGDVQPHPDNWRVHPDAQRGAFHGLVDEIGFAGTILAYEDDGVIVAIDGHLRREEFPDLEVPVVILDVDRNEARQLLATFDPVSQLAEADVANLERLLGQAGLPTGPVSEMMDALLAAERSNLDALGHGGAGWITDQGTVKGRVAETVGYDLLSVWPRDGDEDTRAYPLFPALPKRRNKNELIRNYTRSPALEMERIVQTYLRDGDYFLEVCAGWFTFSMTAAAWGYQGEGVDIWDVSLDFGRRQMRKIAKAVKGSYKIIRGDAMDLPYADATFDFVYCNPPFYQLERYSDDPRDLAARSNLDDWLRDSGRMMGEMARVAKPGALVVTVMADYRDKGNLVPLHALWCAEATRRGLVLHDLVVQTLRTQGLRLWRREYNAKRTVKGHEYVLTFRRPEGWTPTLEGAP